MRPSLADFLSTARSEFGFLISEFGFIEQPDSGPYPNPFSLRYVSPTTVITIDGINWGFGVQVMLDSVSRLPGIPPGIPLWALVEHRAPDEGLSPSGQLAQLSYYASLLRRHAADVLRGTFTAFPAAMQIVDLHASELSKPRRRKLP
jgi:hypothetical protein